MFLSSPVRRCFKTIHTTWDPKRTILNTFATFFLLSYSKFFFVSLNFFLAFHSYNSKGEPISTVLIYDPKIRLFHSEHAPYVVFALSVMLILILLPPLMLLLHPTQLSKKCLRLLGFQRWDIIQYIMDVFQGWYKDGTEGTRDYRYLSALFFTAQNRSWLRICCDQFN